MCYSWFLRKKRRLSRNPCALGKYHSLDDALRNLKVLEREDASFDAEAERLLIQESLEKLRSVGPKIQRLQKVES